MKLVPELIDLCRSSDAVTVHAPLLPSTYQMLQAKHFQAMRPTTVFVNTSKGSIVDEKALVQELQRGRLFAFLDVSDPRAGRHRQPAANAAERRPIPATSPAAPICDSASKPSTTSPHILMSSRWTMQVTREMLDRIA